MSRILLALVAFLSVSPVLAQRSVQSFPREARTAKTIAIVNHTHNDGVEQGAVEALKRWGHYTVEDDPDLADIVLTFDKKTEHTNSSTQKTEPNGETSTGFSATFGSSTSMQARLKGATATFFNTSTSESKKKAGAACVTDLQAAFNSSH